MSLEFNSPPKLTRTVEMTYNRVNIINPLSSSNSVSQQTHAGPLHAMRHQSSDSPGKLASMPHPSVNPGTFDSAPHQPSNAGRLASMPPHPMLSSHSESLDPLTHLSNAGLLDTMSQPSDPRFPNPTSHRHLMDSVPCPSLSNVKAKDSMSHSSYSSNTAAPIPISHPSSSACLQTPTSYQTSSHYIPSNFVESYSDYESNNSNQSGNTTVSRYASVPAVPDAAPVCSSNLETSQLPTESSVTDRIEFPSSALDLYTSILEGLEGGGDKDEGTGGGIQTQDVDSSLPNRMPLQEYHHEDHHPIKIQRSDKEEIHSRMNQFGDDYLTPVGIPSQQYTNEIELQSRLDQRSEHDTATSPIGLSLEAETSIGRFKSNLGMKDSVGASQLGGESGKVEEKLRETNLGDELLEIADTLPDVVENVSQAQKHQLLEVSKQQEILEQVKVQLSAAQDNTDDLVVELSACKRQICLKEDEGMQLQKQCKQIAKDIKNAMAEDFEICKTYRVEEEKRIENNRLYEKYRSKMTVHKQEIATVETTMGIHIEVNDHMQIIASLQAEKTLMESKLNERKSKKQASSNTIAVTAEKTKYEDKIKKQKLEMMRESTKHGAITQDIDVLHKRNQAQLKRLKKQLKEAHLRNRQWNDEACQLEKHLEELRKAMEE